MLVIVASGLTLSFIDDVYADDGPSNNLTEVFKTGLSLHKRNVTT